MLMVGVTGPSGSGKSTLVTSLAAMMNQEEWTVVVMNCEAPYYVGKYFETLDYELLSDIEGPENYNFDRLEADLVDAKNEHDKCSLPTLVLVDTFLLLALSDAVLSLFDFLLYLEADKEVCLTRRLDREQRLGEWSDKKKVALRTYFDNSTWPGYLRYTKARADAFEKERSFQSEQDNSDSVGSLPVIHRVDANKTPEDVLMAAKALVNTSKSRLNSHAQT